MKQTRSLYTFGFGFLLAAGLALLLVIGSGAAAQSGSGQGAAAGSGQGAAAGSGQGAAANSPQTAAQTAGSIGTAITYQGTLDEDGSPASGNYNFRFRLYDALTDGAQLGEITVNNAAVSNGLFTVQLDFGLNAYAAEAVWLEIAVDSGGYQTLTPRQPLTPAPLALNLPNVYTNPATGFVGIGTDTPVAGSIFTVKTATQTGYGGMYVSTSGPTGQPFYGYSTTGSDFPAWHYYSGSTGEWRLHVNGPAIAVDSNQNMAVTGNVSQELASDGLVKAAVFLLCAEPQAPMNRYFNNVNDTPITVVSSNQNTGTCTIDFGFDISDRFWIATASFSQPRVVTCELGATNSQLDCVRTAIDGTVANGNIMVIIY